MTTSHLPHPIQAHFDYFTSAIQTRLQKYNNSNLTPFHDHLLKIFFDLAQQHDGLDSFYQICVAIPCALHPEINTALAILNTDKDGFQLACGSDSPPEISPTILSHIPLEAPAASYNQDNLLILPLVARPMDNPCDTKQQSPTLVSNTNHCLGALLINNFSRLAPVDQLFLEKLGTRIGYNFQRRLLQANHLDHVNFLKRLGRDIGHNVITPNIHFKNLFRQLERKIKLIDNEVKATIPQADEPALHIISRCNEIREELTSCHEELLGHYNRSSLYLETLLREEHFAKGEFIIRPRRCQIEDDIIIPELEVYRNRLERQKITIDQPHNMRGRRFFLNCDLGLLSQVFDNLFSNAMKYTSETTTNHGTPRKAMAYGCSEIDNFQEGGQRGVKFNIFNTGEHLDEKERQTIFCDGVRGSNAGRNPGSGHGLAFVRNVVEIHGGQVGYEAVPGGNNFYFILPLPQEQERE